jgi:uncharacterized protein
MCLTKQQAIDLLHKHMQNINLRRHCYGVSVAMGAVYDYMQSKGMLTQSEPEKEVWVVFGILHDSDYELTKDDWTKHTLLTLDWLKDSGYSESDPLYLAIQSHNNKVTKLREPETQMEWALECCDELSGFVVACALVMPDKKLAALDLDSVKKKFRSNGFAKAVDRGQIAQCSQRLGIELDDFIKIVLEGMQKEFDWLGL